MQQHSFSEKLQKHLEGDRNLPPACWRGWIHILEWPFTFNRRSARWSPGALWRPDGATAEAADPGWAGSSCQSRRGGSTPGDTCIPAAQHRRKFGGSFSVTLRFRSERETKKWWLTGSRAVLFLYGRFYIKVESKLDVYSDKLSSQHCHTSRFYKYLPPSSYVIACGAFMVHNNQLPGDRRHKHGGSVNDAPC